MPTSHHPLSPLEALPLDLLTEILDVVGQGSREDLRNSILTSDELLQSADDPKIFKNMELRDIVASPLLAVDNHHKLMEKCLQHGNVSAHYVRGVLDYFHFNNPSDGLVHLSRAANGPRPVKEAVFLYGVINLCIGQFEVGKAYLDQLRSGNDTSEADICWAKIKRALHGIGVPMNDEYIQSLWVIQPPYVCNLNDMDNTCDKCYHYKQMVKFVYTL